MLSENQFKQIAAFVFILGLLSFLGIYLFFKDALPNQLADDEVMLTGQIVAVRFSQGRSLIDLSYCANITAVLFEEKRIVGPTITVIGTRSTYKGKEQLIVRELREDSFYKR
ncbi:MAG: hypothetical protein H6502_05680 [Candidatus Woesearchaeota archaeon]|nr:MAG: hypothetical protein H6502_05680 [Candidatus Woesearchaeota archaeon]